MPKETQALMKSDMNLLLLILFLNLMKVSSYSSSSGSNVSYQNSSGTCCVILSLAKNMESWPNCCRSYSLILLATVMYSEKPKSLKLLIYDSSIFFPRPLPRAMHT